MWLRCYSYHTILISEETSIHLLLFWPIMQKMYFLVTFFLTKMVVSSNLLKKKLWNFNMVLRCMREGYPDWKGKKKEKSFLFIEENVKIYIVLPFDDLIFSNCVFLWVNIPMTYEQKQFFHFLHFWMFDGKNCEKWGEIYMSTLLFF